jgi:hypothetical protein
MARSQNSFIKKAKAEKKRKKRKEKIQRKIDKKNQKKGGSFEDMLAYLDEDGNITSTPPDATDSGSQLANNNKKDETGNS